MERAHTQLICLLVSILCINATAILNPGFEEAFFNTDPYINPPMNWSYENYASVVSSFTPMTERGMILDWRIDAPCEGNYFLVLATGCMGPGSDTAISYSTIYQEAFFHAGEMLSFNWFFGTSDYRPYYDYALAKLVPVNPADNLSTLELIRVNVHDVGDFGSTNGWQYTSFIFDAANAGRYNLIFEVHDDSRDTVYESYFAIDNIIPEPASLLLLVLGGFLIKRRR